jgi:hypothetical protein
MGNPFNANLIADFALAEVNRTTYRPQQWTLPPGPATLMIDFAGVGDAPQYSPSGIGATLSKTPTTYIFDCVILADHEQRVRKTEHPVQTGAAVSDHAFIEPARLSLDIGMSDAMDAYYPTFTGENQSKSVNAYQTLILLMFSRIPLSITTRLRVYDNMIVEEVHPQESYKTYGGLRCRVAFGEVYFGQIQSTPVSTRGQDTQSNSGGTLIPTPVNDATRERKSLSGVQNVPAYPSNAPGAGPWSSNDVTSLQYLPPK